MGVLKQVPVEGLSNAALSLAVDLDDVLQWVKSRSNSTEFPIEVLDKSGAPTSLTIRALTPSDIINVKSRH